MAINFLYINGLEKKKIIFIIGEKWIKTKENYIINNGILGI
jgi:hypothetical protein